MLKGSDDLEAVLAAGPDIVLRAAAYRGKALLGEVPISATTAPSLSITGAQVSRRSLSVTLVGDDAMLWFSQPSTTLRMWSGALVAGSPQYLPVHWGVALNPTRDTYAGTVTFTSPDLGQRVVNAVFTSPTASVRGLTIVQQIASLVHGAIPWITVDDQTFDMTACPHLSWDLGASRSDAIASLAASITAEAFFGPDGTFVIRPLRTLRSKIDHRAIAGVNLVAPTESFDFQSAKNVIVASNQTASGSSLFGISEDLDDSSPLNVQSCGPNVGQITNSALTTNAACRTFAYVTRLRLQGYPVSVNYGIAVHPGVECGDVHQVHWGSSTFKIVPNSISFGLTDASATMSGPSATLPLPAVT